jgi:peptidoglycan LD-endopeptidase CwlK
MESGRILQLKPIVREKARSLMEICGEKGIEICLTSAFRNFREQDRLYEQGRTKPGKIVTNARGGYSFHNYGVAFDICPKTEGKLNWNDKKLFGQVGQIGESLGLEWGGSWKKFKDPPHFQYTAGYLIADFITGRIDPSKFEI